MSRLQFNVYAVAFNDRKQTKQPVCLYGDILVFNIQAKSRKIESDLEKLLNRINIQKIIEYRLSLHLVQYVLSWIYVFLERSARNFKKTQKKIYIYFLFWSTQLSFEALLKHHRDPMWIKIMPRRRIFVKQVKRQFWGTLWNVLTKILRFFGALPLRMGGSEFSQNCEGDS